MSCHQILEWVEALNKLDRLLIVFIRDSGRHSLERNGMGEFESEWNTTDDD